MKREASKAGSSRLWKATLGRRLGLEEVERAASESVAVLLRAGEAAGSIQHGVELERMDVDRGGRTTVFFGASRRAPGPSPAA